MTDEWRTFVAKLESEKAETIAKGKETEAELLEETAEEVNSDQGRRVLERTAYERRSAAEEWRKGMGGRS